MLVGRSQQAFFCVRAKSLLLHENDAVCFALFDLLFKISEFGRVEKFREGDAKAIAKHFEGHNARIDAFSVENIFDRRGGNGGFGCQLVDRHFMFTQ